MRALLSGVLLSLFVTLPLTAKMNGWSATIKKADKAVFYIETIDSEGSGGCTGFVINVAEKLAMTANHCDPGKNGTIWADRVQAEVVAKDTKKDLLVIRLKEMDPTREALSLADKNPSVGEDVMSVGFGYALDTIQFRKAGISSNTMTLPRSDIVGPFITTNTSFTPGQSGGPVLNEAGNVVAIVQMGDPGTMGIGVGAETIRQRLGRFFQTAAPTK